MSSDRNGGNVRHFISEEDFLNAIKTEKQNGERKRREDSDEVRAYFSSLVECTEQEESDRFAALEGMLMRQCCKIDLEDSYFIPDEHPIMQVLYGEEQDLKHRYAELDNEDSCDTEWRIRHALMQQFRKHRQDIYMYSASQVYYMRHQGSAGDLYCGFRKAVAWPNVGTLTSLDALRLLQKVMVRYARRKEQQLVGGDQAVRIAYIGEINHQKDLHKYFEEKGKEGKKEDIPSKILFTRFKRQPEYGEYIFRREDINWESLSLEEKQVYNLYSITDMQELFRSFDIVLFLDESYFYKQRQKPKQLNEKWLQSHIEWCWKEIERIEHQFLNDSGKTEAEEAACEREKRYYYKEIYNKTGLWLNGYEKEETSKLGFDQELFRVMKQAVCTQSDVYVYISRGKTIGKVDLAKQSVCNDERYDGKRMFVYKFANVTDEKPAPSEEAEILVNADRKAEEALKDDKITPDGRSVGSRIASIDLWRLLKSIGEDCYQYYCKDDEGELSYHNFQSWETSYLDIYACREEHSVSLYWKLRYDQENIESAQEQRLRDFVESYFSICTKEKDPKHSPYSRKYLCDLFAGSMVARAESAFGIFCAYLLSEQYMPMENLTEMPEDISVIQTAHNSGSSLFRGRRLIYTTICGLDRVVFRDVEKKLDILQYDFRSAYCPELETDIFLRLLGMLKQYCEYTKYTDSRLYMLVK